MFVLVFVLVAQLSKQNVFNMAIADGQPSTANWRQHSFSQAFHRDFSLLFYFSGSHEFVVVLHAKQPPCLGLNQFQIHFQGPHVNGNA